MSQRTEQETREDIREIVVAMAPDPGGAAEADPALVEDLGYHSLALLELAFALEDEYGLPAIDQEIARRIRCVSDVQDYVVGQLRAVDGGAA
ncbi:hypothetical protein [Kitasatospora sp. GP82]|uniref:hypothetical protein n=1 Tax=Kitasatospora sp. GP82 TaxID=3035089 RepID=UPI0024741EE8|nr:hypothetical protein [Kitasatospora sp. GP82]MDH6128353.1 acyl carrier protein [Kitasatospora sp. GP82]